MNAIRLHQYGTSNELKYEDISIPRIDDNQILIKVYAVSVNHLDILKASGSRKDAMPLDFPWIPGHDFAGIVENEGSGTIFSTGDKVYGNCTGGSFAEYLAADVSKVTLKPDCLTFVEAASVPHVAETAWQAVHTHGELKPGQKVLIHGAAGAVGAYAVQFAKKAGATVYATAAASGKELLESIGADVVIDYKTTDFTTVARDMDLVLVLVGGDIQMKSYPVLKEGGRLVSITGPIIQEEADKYKVTAISMGMKQSIQDLKTISHMFHAGTLKTDVAVVYDLKDAVDGWKILAGEDPGLPGFPHGKIVLEVFREETDTPVI